MGYCGEDERRARSREHCRRSGTTDAEGPTSTMCFHSGTAGTTAADGSLAGWTPNIIIIRAYIISFYCLLSTKSQRDFSVPGSSTTTQLHISPFLCRHGTPITGSSIQPSNCNKTTDSSRAICAFTFISMSFNIAASHLGPLVLGRGTRVALRRSTRASKHLPAVALLLPLRAYATDTSTSSSGNGNYPPPGFDPEQAKKPLPKEIEQQKKADTSKESSGPSKPSIPTHKPTETAPTDAAENVSVNEMAAEKISHDKSVELASGKKKEEKKLTLGQRIMKEVHHYWDGTKLLAAEVRISSKLAVKMSAGYELTRREHRQLQRTVQDLGRLVPFSVFVIVPFAELLLPIALRLFPNLLPSTYEGQKSKESKATKLRATRKEVSNFLRSTLRESGLPVSAANAQREEFTEFFRKVCISDIDH